VTTKVTAKIKQSSITIGILGRMIKLKGLETGEQGKIHLSEFGLLDLLTGTTSSIDIVGLTM
jgi:hypothetical protein